MRLLEFELNNFKQYYGNQRITFAGVSDIDEKNVTVIYGENGRGKTTIYRALMFCLFGDRILDQDKNYERVKSENPSIYIANLKALQDDFNTDRNGVYCSVSVTFEHKNHRYTLERGLYSIQLDNEQIIEEDNLLKLSITDESGNTDIMGSEEHEQIRRTINSIIDYRVSYFFLFDGERIERLTKATSEQKREVGEGIRNLLKIDNLEIANKALKMLESRINKELQKISSGDHLKKLREIETYNNQIDSIKSTIIEKQTEIAKAAEHREAIDNELALYKDIKELITQRRNIETNLQLNRQQKMAVQAEMRKTTQGISFIIGKDALNMVSADIDQKRTKGQVPSDIRKELIDRILEEMKCICGRNLTMNSSEHLEILKWSQQSTSQAFTTYIMDFYRELGMALVTAENEAEKIKRLLSRIGQIDEQLDELAIQLEQVKKTLGGVPDIDIASKESYRDTLLSKITTLEIEEKALDQSLKDVLIKLDKANKECQELAKELKIQNDLTQKQNLVQKATTVLANVRDQFVEDIIVELEEKSNNNFEKLIDGPGRQSLKWIKINPDYSLDVLDWNGRPFLANISAGQRQVVSLSFITALAQTAGGSKVLELPLFMDTPFGRLGGKHRDNLLEVIPEITPQWILLATETEFGATEYQKLKDTGRWGKVYVLESIQPGVTEIKEEQVSLFKPKR